MRVVVVALVGLIAGGCTAKPAPVTPIGNLVLLTRDGCSNTAAMKANLDNALKALGQRAEYDVINLETLSRGDARQGYPTPTVLVSNRDLFGMAEPRPPFPDPT